MKKYLYLLLLTLPMPVQAEYNSKGKLDWDAKILMTFPCISETLTYEDESVTFRFKPDILEQECTFIGVIVGNKTSERIYIEWENARICGSRAISGINRRITMDLEKPNEAISSGEDSELRYITPQRNVTENSLKNIYYHYGKNKNVDVPILIPVKFKDKIIDYKFTINFSHYTEEEIDSLYQLKKDTHALSKKIMKGAEIDSVLAIMGKPEVRKYNLLIYPFLVITLDETQHVKKIKRMGRIIRPWSIL